VKKPIPIRVFTHLISRLRYPVLTVGFVVFLLLIIFFITSGSVFPDADNLPDGWNNSLEITGLFILLSAMPAYLLMCFTATIRTNDAIHDSLDSLLDTKDKESIDRSRNANYWPLAMLVGILFAYASNINWEALTFEFGENGFLVSISLVFGQFFMWSIIGMFLFFSMLEVRALNRKGQLVKIDLYDLDKLNGFGKAALIGFLIVMGALALTTLQSLDQEFGWDKYRNALAVGIPASLMLILAPTWAIHCRMRDAKVAHLVEIKFKIQHASRAIDDEALPGLNALLQRKDQIHSLRTWPMDLSIVSRFALYVLIPPLAWAGAALTELYLDSFIAS